jgi:hypothetical protein
LSKIIFFYEFFTTRIDISYNKYSGRKTRDRVIGSPVGVISAARIIRITTACLRYLFRNSLLRTPILERSQARRGNSKTNPSIKIIPRNVLIYEFRDI